MLAVAVSISACREDRPASAPSNTAVGEAGATGARAEPGTLRIARVGELTIDPKAVLLSDPAGLITLDLLYDGVTTYPKGVAGTGGPGAMAATAEPDLAESMERNADATIWTVKLRDRTFSDGSPIRAGDVKASLERIAAPGDASLGGARLEIVNGYPELTAGASPDLSGLRAIDDRTLEIALREPYTQLPELLASPVYGVIPSTIAASEDVSLDRAVSSGPYRVASTTEAAMRLERSPGARAAAGPDAVQLVGFESWDDAFGAFQAGGLDWTLVPAAAAPGVQAGGEGKAFTIAGTTVWFGMNVANPALADQRFRTAVVRAIDSQRVVDDGLSGAVAVRAIVPRGVPGYDDAACADACGYDQEAAKRLLSEAFPDGSVPTVPVDVYDDPTQIAMADSIKAQLDAVGIPAEVRTRTFADYQSLVSQPDRGVFSFGTVGTAPIGDVYLVPPFTSGSGDNATGLAVAEIDAAARAARAEPDPAAREGLYRALQRQILAVGAVVPVAQQQTNQVISSRVQGWTSRLDGTFVVGEVKLAS